MKTLSYRVVMNFLLISPSVGGILRCFGDNGGESSRDWRQE